MSLCISTIIDKISQYILENKLPVVVKALPQSQHDVFRFGIRGPMLFDDTSSADATTVRNPLISSNLEEIAEIACALQVRKDYTNVTSISYLF